MLNALAFVARHGRAALVLGLVAGLFLPDLARLLRPWLPQMVAGLLFLTAFRIGARAALGGLSEGLSSLRAVLVLQLILPLAALLLLWLTGLAGGLGGFATTGDGAATTGDGTATTGLRRRRDAAATPPATRRGARSRLLAQRELDHSPHASRRVKAVSQEAVFVTHSDGGFEAVVAFLDPIAAVYATLRVRLDPATLDRGTTVHASRSLTGHPAVGVET